MLVIENIIKNKPRPETLDKELVNYIGYDDKKTSR